MFFFNVIKVIDLFLYGCAVGVLFLVVKFSSRIIRILLKDSTKETLIKGLFTEIWQKLKHGRPAIVASCYYA